MNKSISIKAITLAGVLSAITIAIPLIMPRIPIGTAGTITLGFHVPVTLAMFINPIIGGCVALISSIGFFLNGTPPIVALRALSQVVFVVLGACLIKKGFFGTIPKTIGLVAICTLVHAACEYIVVCFYYSFAPAMMFESLLSVFLITILHGTMDFLIALLLLKPLQKARLL